MRRGLAWGTVGLAIATLAAIAVMASGRAQSWPLAFAVAAFPALAFAGSALVAAVALWCALRARSWWAVGTAGVALAFAVVVATIGIVGPASTQETVTADASAEQLTVVVWNTDQRNVSERQLRAVIDANSADVLVLPEYFAQLAESGLAQLAEDRDMQIVGYDSSAVTVLVSRELGTYRLVDVDSTPPWAGFIAASDDPSAPTILAAHLQRPLISSTATWREHTAWVERACDRYPNLIAAGDFNSTNANLDGASIGACDDAAASLGQTVPGTWPTALPARLGAAIDHVFVGDEWATSGRRGRSRCSTAHTSAAPTIGHSQRSSSGGSEDSRPEERLALVRGLSNLQQSPLPEQWDRR